MNPILHPGTHPNAENLAAFAERSLPQSEQDQILSHMASCDRCREVVFLAQRALEEEQTDEVPVQAEVPVPRHTSWPSGWRWAWITATAFAVFLGIAVIRHTRNAATQTQMDARMSQTEPLRNSGTAAAAPPSMSSSPLKETPNAKPSEVRERDLTRADKDVDRQFDQEKAVEQKQLTPGPVPSSVPITPGVNAGSIHGMMPARAKGSSLGGPMAANQLEQQNSTAQQNAAINPVTSNAPVTVASESVKVLPQSLPTPAPSAMQVQPSNSKVALDNLESQQINPPPLHQAANPASLKGLETLSSVSTSGRTIALDTTGALFLSEDLGKHWQPIPMQWSGRAVLLRIRPMETRPPTSQGLTKSQRSAGVQTMQFELVNDKLQTWVSVDGKTWTAQPRSLK